MKVIHTKQQWKGFFSYQDGYDSAPYRYQEVAFKLDIIITKDSFTGTSIDSESELAFNDPATVKGFIDKDTISFVMKYPCAYYKDENTGEIKLDRTSEHPDIHYLGYFSPDKQQVTGNWEMTIAEEKHLDGYLEEIWNGEFQMTRI